jgi:hypothetical protein
MMGSGPREHMIHGPCSQGAHNLEDMGMKMTMMTQCEEDCETVNGGHCGRSYSSHVTQPRVLRLGKDLSKSS